MYSFRWDFKAEHFTQSDRQIYIAGGPFEILTTMFNDRYFSYTCSPEKSFSYASWIVSLMYLSARRWDFQSVQSFDTYSVVHFEFSRLILLMADMFEWPFVQQKVVMYNISVGVIFTIRTSSIRLRCNRPVRITFVCEYPEVRGTSSLQPDFCCFPFPLLIGPQ